MHTKTATIGTVIVAVLALCGVARAAEVGTVASLEGTGEIGRAGSWTAAAIGSAVGLGDEVRTGRPGRMRIVFQDDSVLTVSDDSRVVIDEHVFDPNGSAKSLLGLLQGKVSALVSDYYNRAGNNYEIKTPTAIAGVRGTEFEMSYDPDAEVTNVVGLSGHVEVHSVFDPAGPGVLITASQTTTVVRNRYPTQPERLDDTMFRQRLEGLRFTGGGRAEGLLTANTVRTGASVPPQDRAPAVGSTVPMGKRDASSLVGDSPAIVKAMTGQIGIVFPH